MPPQFGDQPLDGRTLCARSDSLTSLFPSARESRDPYLPTIYGKMTAWNGHRLAVLYWMRQSCRRSETRKKQRREVRQL